MPEIPHKPTATERRKIRSVIYGGAGQITIGENADGTWFGDVFGTVVEAPSPAELLRELATVLEEA